jgi:hypothetical protein
MMRYGNNAMLSPSQMGRAAGSISLIRKILGSSFVVKDKGKPQYPRLSVPFWALIETVAADSIG